MTKKTKSNQQALAVKETPWGKAVLSTKPQFVQITDQKTFARECNFALQAFKKNSTLQSCPLPSIQEAVMNIALTGATLNPVLKQANLIPRKVKGVMICCLDFQYRGLIKLATKEGAVLDMDADVVYNGDEFYYQRGTEPLVRHIPALNRDKGAEITHVYATALLPNNPTRKFIVLNRDDVDKVRNSSVAPNSPMWQDWYEEGARKTAIKRLYKMLPQTENMSTAIDVINKHEGIDFEDLKEKASPARKLEDAFGSEPAGDNGGDSEEQKPCPDKCQPCYRYLDCNIPHIDAAREECSGPFHDEAAYLKIVKKENKSK
jgi:recombination protein RecT